MCSWLPTAFLAGIGAPSPEESAEAFASVAPQLAPRRYS